MLALAEQFVVDAEGNKTSVIIPMKQYEKLIEDLHDLAVVAERRPEEPITLPELERRLKEDGRNSG
jgi:hypothetical protein